MTPLGAVFPTTIASGMIVLIADNLHRQRAPKREAPTADAGVSRRSTWRRIAIAAALVLRIILIPYPGFAVAGLAGFVAVTAIANHDRLSMARVLVHGATALVISAVFYMLMANVPLIRMPQGLLF
jgi:hypothetical protein